MWTKPGKHALRAVAVCTLLLCFSAPQSWAWGREGHRLTALVAEQYLTPETKVQIVTLLHKETLADIAPWADEYRVDHPETGAWHFVDIPKDAAAFDRRQRLIRLPCQKPGARQPHVAVPSARAQANERAGRLFQLL